MPRWLFILMVIVNLLLAFIQPIKDWLRIRAIKQRRIKNTDDAILNYIRNQLRSDKHTEFYGLILSKTVLKKLEQDDVIVYPEYDDWFLTGYNIYQGSIDEDIEQIYGMMKNTRDRKLRHRIRVNVINFTGVIGCYGVTYLLIRSLLY